jgi:glycerophosphoryl diester phosphodiesterase
VSASPRRIEVIGHGGAGDFFPGNSRQSIEQALKIGVDRIEFDVQRSADGQIVLVHDERINAGSRGKAPTRSLTTAELRAALPGLLTLREAVELIGNSASLLVDVKHPGYERELIAELKSLKVGAGHAVSSTHISVLRAVQAEIPELRIGLSTGHLSGAPPWPLGKRVAGVGLRWATPLPLLIAAKAMGATDLMVQYRVCSRFLVRAAHRLGLRVNTWTVDHPRQIRRVIDLGVDGVISNRPDLVRELLRS